MRTLNLVANTSAIDSDTTVTADDTPTPKNNDVIHYDTSIAYSVQDSIKNAGYTLVKQIDETLQGSIWKVSDENNAAKIIKIASKLLHTEGVTYVTGKRIETSENILKERDILKYLSQSVHQSPSSLVTYSDFFCDKYNYFLVMSFGGSMSLLDFVQNCHHYIDQGVISIREWQSVCKTILKQMVDLLDWLHNSMHVCHLDISLENVVIDNVNVMHNPDSKQIRFAPGFQCSLIDFGVAEVFLNKNDWNCTKYVGKTLYKAPEVAREKPFDPRAADCWSLAVVIFVMTVGCQPFSKPCMEDVDYRAIMNGSIRDLLSQWNRLGYVTPNILNLMQCLFQEEKYRVTIQNAKKHPFFLS